MSRLPGIPATYQKQGSSKSVCRAAQVCGGWWVSPWLDGLGPVNVWGYTFGCAFWGQLLTHGLLRSFRTSCQQHQARTYQLFNLLLQDLEYAPHLYGIFVKILSMSQREDQGNHSESANKTAASKGGINPKSTAKMISGYTITITKSKKCWQKSLRSSMPSSPECTVTIALSSLSHYETMFGKQKTFKIDFRYELWIQRKSQTILIKILLYVTIYIKLRTPRLWDTGRTCAKHGAAPARLWGGRPGAPAPPVADVSPRAFGNRHWWRRSFFKSFTVDFVMFCFFVVFKC